MPLADLKSKYTKKDLRRGPKREKWGIVEEVYGPGHEPHNNYFYGFLGMIYDGINTLEDLKTQMSDIFISSTHQLVVEPQDVEEYLQSAKMRKLVVINKENKIELTEKGRRMVELCYHINLHTSYWMSIFFSERTVMFATTLFLIILSLLKIITGLQLRSQGMLNEGFENLTDIIKIAIIAILSFKLNKDKLASFIIICLMLFTGVILIWSGVDALLNPSEIIPTIQAYIISFVSVALNTGLMFLKSMVGRNSGNLSLLSDSKDSQINIYISCGVLIGLTFAIFKYYFVDAIIGIIIAIIIFKEGIEIIWELASKEEDFDITEIKVFADNIYDNRLTGYLLANIRRGYTNRSRLLDKFKQGLNLGRLYYEGFADFFYENLDQDVAEKHLNKLIEGGYIKEFNTDLSLTNKGLKNFYKAKAKEFETRAKDIYEGFNFRKGPFLCLFVILILVLLTIFANEINTWLASI